MALKKIRPSRSENDLRKAARHVGYEIQMLTFSAEVLGASHASPPTNLSENDTNMAMECFLLHFRNVRSFLCPSLQWTCDDDILACNYFSCEERDVADAARLGLDKRRIDGMVAHLSYRRDDYVARGDVGWQIAKMTVSILEETNSFLRQLPQGWKEHFAAPEELEKYIARARSLSRLKVKP
jgi:hypothetical protein